MYRLYKKFEMSCAHRIPGYQGPCERIHGHTYTVEIYIRGTQLNELGMLVDFSQLKKKIHGKYDHTLLNDFPEFQDGNNPTTEIVAKTLGNQIIGLLPHFVHLDQVRVWETPSAYVEWQPDYSYTPFNNVGAFWGGNIYGK